MTDLLLVQKAAAGGYVLKETTRRFRGPTGWETETERTYAAPDWRAAGWVLERTYGPEFRRLTQVELSGPHGGPVQVAATDVDDLAARVLLNIEAHRGELPGPDEPVDAEVVDDDRARAS
jgi:hypothetical protein